jgi:dipeptidyl aminopeptidase/acylaminoacyl peptidase
MKRRWLVAGGATLIVVVLSGFGFWSALHHPNRVQSKVMVKPSTNQSPSARATPVPDPITIPAMKARKYETSTIKVERNLGDQGGYSVRVVSFQSDGNTEYAYWAEPDGSAPSGGWPAIVLVHGYINPAQYSTTGNAYKSWIAAWARAGFVVVQPDLRGNGLSQGNAVSGHWDSGYTYDVMNLLMSLRAEERVNAAKIGVVGHSMGGHIALNVAVIDPKVVATILVNGVVASMYDLVYNWPNSPAPHDQPSAAVQSELNGLVQAHGSPKDNPGFWGTASAINYVADVKGPVEIDADEGDSVVPYAFSQSLEHALTVAHKPVTLNTYAGNDHQLSSAANLNEFLQRSIAFWRQALR